MKLRANCEPFRRQAKSTLPSVQDGVVVLSIDELAVKFPRGVHRDIGGICRCVCLAKPTSKAVGIAGAVSLTATCLRRLAWQPALQNEGKKWASHSKGIDFRQA
jgi:hypothetical protein